MRLYMNTRDLDEWRAVSQEDIGNGFFWSIVSQHGDLNTEYLREWSGDLDWHLLSMSYNFSSSELEEFKDFVDWNYISLYQHFTEEGLEKWKEKINWNEFSRNRFINEKIIKKYWNLLNKRYLLYQEGDQYSPELRDFITEYVNKYGDY